MDEILCIGCGCSHENPCVNLRTDDTCSWLSVDVVDGRGVCSACPDDLRRFIAGDREILVEVPV